MFFDTKINDLSHVFIEKKTFEAVQNLQKGRILPKNVEKRGTFIAKTPTFFKNKALLSKKEALLSRKPPLFEYLELPFLYKGGVIN